MAKPKAEMIYAIHCLSPAHKADGEEGFYLFTKREPLDVLGKLGCPLGCGENNFKIEDVISPDEFFFLADEFDKAYGFKKAFHDIGSKYEAIDIGKFRKSYGEKRSERQLVPVEQPATPKKKTKPIDLPALVAYLNALEAFLRKWIVGQLVPIRKVMRRFRHAEVGLRYPNRPKGTFLFMGPTGVGKTELVKKVMAFLTGREEPHIHLDMQDYQEPHDAKKITGAPPSYIGYGDPTVFEPIDDIQDDSIIILLDEIEKAHPKVWNALLGIFNGEPLEILKTISQSPTGRQQVQRKKLSFARCYFFLTSNIGSEEVGEFLEKQKSKRLGFLLPNPSGPERKKTNEEIKKICIEQMKKTFPAPFIGRINEVVVFNKLEKKQDLEAIIDLRMEELEPTFAPHKLKIKLSPKAREFLMQKGFDETRGARSLKDAVEKYVSDALSQGLLEGKIKPGDEVLMTEEILKTSTEEDDTMEYYELQYEVLKDEKNPAP